MMFVFKFEMLLYEYHTNMYTVADKIAHIITQFKAVYNEGTQIEQNITSELSIHDIADLIIGSDMTTISIHTKRIIDTKLHQPSIYEWDILKTLTDFEEHRHRKSHWPVLPNHDPMWIERAVRLGVPVNRLMRIIGQEYPGGEQIDGVALINRVNEYKLAHPRRGADEKHDPPEIKVEINEQKNARRNKSTEWLRENTTWGHYNMITSNTKVCMSMEQATNIYNMYCKIGSDDYAVLFAMNLMVDTNTAHLAIKNPALMNMLTTTMEQHPKLKPVVAQNALVYAFRALFMEERMQGKRAITSANRGWWQEEEFMALPVFNYLADRSPYCAIIPGYIPLFQQLWYHVIGERRFTTRDEYMDRMNYISRYQGEGKVQPVHELIPYNNWTKHTNHDYPSSMLALSGGIHQSCCGIKPIEKNYTNHEDMYDNIYPGQDRPYGVNWLWEMFYSIAHRYLKRKCIKLTDVQRWDVDYIIDLVKKQPTSWVTENIIARHDIIIDMCSQISDMDISIHCDTFTQYEEVVSDVFQTLQQAGYTRIYLRKIPRTYKHKYAIMGPDLTRPIDLYMIRNTNVQLMRQFHLDPVRILWDGTRRWALSSAVGFHLTGVVTTLIWLSNNKDPIDLVTTYSKRGCAKFMNTQMQAIYKNALNEVTPFNKYPIQIGPVHYNHGVFVDHLIRKGRQVTMNNAPVGYERHTGHKWYNGNKVIPPPIETFHGLISNAM